MSSIRKTGTVKWFNPTKGYGFITLDDGTPDAFVHVSEVEKAELSTLAENQKVEFELQENKGKMAAVNLKLI
ncbi:MAG: cold-shock protein [Alphaproteobacteria bacterium]|jgi:CspA family cold shock protein|nr:cold-shock protein [Alphaproteobacteria bacterium]MDF3033985.1 cold-shock protein [Alphaproteobacteria bacterium]